MRKFSLLLAAAVAVSLSACGGGSASTNNNPGTGSNPSGSSSPAVVTAGDAPMSSVLAALVTVSAVSFTSSAGAVQLLNQPRQIELTHLGGIRAPLDLHALPEGTYSSLAITVSAAQITYIDPNTGQPVVATATIPSASATQTIALSTPLVVNDTNATDIRFDFDLQKSLDLTGSTVTFTPSISAAVARVHGESDGDRVLHINGTVTAVTASAVTLTTDDSGLSVTLNVNSSTQWDDSMTLASLQVGAVVHTEATVQDDGSLTALLIADADGGTKEDANSRMDAGVVTAVTRDSNNSLTSFTMVVRNSSDVKNIGQTLTVNIGSGTTFKDSVEAQNAGMAVFDQTQVFAGAAVRLSGTIGSVAATVVARAIRPAAVYPHGLTAAAVQTGTNGGFVLSLLLDSNSYFAQHAGLSTLTVDTNANTVFDGSTLTSANVATLALGSPLTASGFLSLSGTTTTLFAAHLHEEAH